MTKMDEMTIRDIIENIDEADDIYKIQKMITDKLNELSRVATRKRKIGDTVSFSHKGKKYVGRITKINRKTTAVSVNMINGSTVPTRPIRCTSTMLL